MSSSFKASIESKLQTPKKAGLRGSEREERQSTAAKLQEYQNRLRKGNNLSSQPSGENTKSRLKPPADNKLGNSIAAMNSSITDKWRKINSKGLKSQAGLNNTVGGGFKGSALQDKSTLDKESNDNEITDQPDKEIGEGSVKTKMALQARLNEVKVS